MSHRPRLGGARTDYGLRFPCELLERRLNFAAPAAPVIIEPLTEGEVVSNFDVHMEVDPDAYSDPDGHAHQATSWQIRETAANGGATVWQALNVTDPLSKYHIHLGDGAFVGTLAGRTALLANRDYVLRATLTDSNNEASPASVRNFHTAAETTPVPGAGTWIAQEGYAVELATAGAGVFRMPVNVAFVPSPGPNPTDPLYYVTELYGSIKMVTRNGTVSNYATGLLDYDPTGPISGTGEQGLAGLAIDPASGDLFVGMLWNNGASDATRGGATVHYPKVERLHSTDGGRTVATRTIIRNMQPEVQGQSHQISNISIGPDGKLYVHMGDGFTASTALNLDQYRGKVLRMNLDGSAPTDNPFYNATGGINARDYVYTYGHRNPFGGAWRASNNRHYVVENGNGLDRMVPITSGQSYGWDGNDSTLTANSIYVWNPATAPVNIAFVQPQTFGGSLFPASTHDDAFVTLSGPTYAAGPQARGKRIERFTDVDTLSGGKLTTAPSTLVRYNGTGRATMTALAAGPDGLYFADMYEDSGASGPVAAGANVYRVRYVDFHPGGVSASAGDAQVALNWTADALAAGYNVYRRTGSGAGAYARVGSNVSGTSFTDTTAANGTQYEYVVRGVNAGGESTDSNSVTATPAGAPADQPPTVATAAAGTVNAGATSAALSVLGADDGGEANLTYTWALQGTPPAAVTFSANATNAAKATTATFTAAGTYNFVVTVRDAANQTAQSTVGVTVNQNLTSVDVSPPAATVTAGGTQQFAAAARDQFGAALATQPAFTWAVDAGGVGTVSAAGLYQAPASGGGTATVRATAGGGISDTAAVAVSPVPTGTGNGLAAVYFNNADLTGTSVVRTDPAVDFDFGAATPDPFIAAETFSARWVGFVEPRFSETYTFGTFSDDGVRLWVDGHPVIDQWTDHTAARHTGTAALVAGQRHAVRLEYYQNAGPAVARLLWQSASQAEEVVPQSQLYSAAPVKVNFQPFGRPRSPVPVPPGYIADYGAVFGANGQSYGWNGRTAGGRDRNRTGSPDQRYDTFLPLRRQSLRRGVWELAVPDGAYRVHVVAGDAALRRGLMKVNVEGTPVVDGALSPTQHWAEGWSDVTVADGRLTVTGGLGARNNRVNFIDVIPMGLTSGAPGATSASLPGSEPVVIVAAWSPPAAEESSDLPSVTQDLLA